MEITMVDLVVVLIFLILIGMLVVLAAWGAYILVIGIYDAVARKWYYWGKGRDKKYERVAREWFEKGNRILKIRKMVFIPTWYDSEAGLVGVCCKGEKCYRWDRWSLSWHKIGRIISRKNALFSFFLPSSIEPISKETFIDNLIISNSYYHPYQPNIGNDIIGYYIFSFDTTDMDLFPDWVTAELVAKKLEES